METDATEKLFIKNVSLLIAIAKNSDRTSVERLLSEGADINFTDSNGNTPLHYAVKFSQVEIVKLLLSHKSDVNTENLDFDTPLDIAINLKKSNNIIRELQKTIIENSEQIIENETLDQLEGGNINENSPEDEITTEIPRAVEKEIEKKKEKIKKCLVYLNNLSHNNPSQNADYTHKHIITFIFFLDAIAFQDIEESAEIKREIRKEIEEKHGKGNEETEKEIRKVIKERKEMIKKEVLAHFRDNFYPKDFKEDQKRINKSRWLLCHSTDDKFLLSDFKEHLVAEGISLPTFIEKLIEYVTLICNNFNESRENTDCKSIKLSNLIQDFSKKEVLKEEIKISDHNMKKFIYSIYNKDEWNPEEAQEQLFELLVNIFPAYQNEIRDLDILRNKIIHAFSKYESIEEIINMEFDKTIFDLRSRLYKYYYAKEVFKILHNLKIGDEYEEVDKKLQGALENFQKEFEEYCTVQGNSNPKRTIAAADDVSKSYEYKIHKTSVLPGFQQEKVPDFVNDYVNFMSIIYYEKTDDVKQINDETHPLQELDHTMRRKIYDRFKKLRQINTYFPHQYKEEKKSFKKYLARFYGVNGSLFDEVCKLYIESDKNPQNMNERVKKRITDTICILRKFQTSYYKYSIDDVITLYSRLIMDKGNFDFEKNTDLFKNCHLAEVQKPNFLKEFDGLFKEEFLELTLSQKKIQMKTIPIVSNILRIFHNQYNSYHINFNNITEIFSDKVFLDNLIDLEISFRKNLKKKNANHYASIYFSILVVIFRNIIKLQYSYPFIVRVITDENIMNTANKSNKTSEVILKDELINVITKEDLLTLVEAFLDRYEFVDYLYDFLKNIYFEGIDFYEIVVKKLPDIDLEKMKPIFEDPVHVKKIMTHLLTSTNQIAITKVLRLLNIIIDDLYRKGNFDEALQILDQYVYDKLMSTNHLEILEAKRLKARIRNRQGEKKKGLQASKDELGTEAKQEFTSALELYNDIKLSLEKIHVRTFEENAIHLLTLSHIAYTHHLLRNFAASYDYYEMVFLEVHKLALDLPTKPLLSTCLKEDITTLKPYIDLIEFSRDTNTYLSAMKIRENMAFQLIYQARSLPREDKKLKGTTALEIYREIYFTQRRKFTEHNLKTAYVIVRIARSHVYLAKVYKKSKETSTLHCLRALNCLNRAYQVYNLDGDYPVITNICKKILDVLDTIKYNEWQ